MRVTRRINRLFSLSIIFGLLSLQSSASVAKGFELANYLSQPHVSRDDATSFTNSDTASFLQNEDIVHLHGSAEVRRPDGILKGEDLRYFQKTGRVQAEGQARLFYQGNLVAAPQMHYNVKDASGEATHAKYRLITGGSGQASKVTIYDKNHIGLDDASYSGCDCDASLWYVKAPRVDFYDKENDGVAHNATLYIKGIPVFWSPYLSFPIKHERKSGFLAPTIGYTTRGGYDLSVPYYFNLAPNYDATLTPRMITRRGLYLGVQARYLTLKSNTVLLFGLMPRDHLVGRKRWSYGVEHHQSLGHWLGLRFGLNVNWNGVSDGDVYSDFREGFDGTVGDNRYLQRVFQVSASGYKYWTGSLTIQKDQFLAPLNASYVPAQYEKLPELKLVGSRYDWGGFDVHSENTITRFVFPTYTGSLLPYTAYTGGHRAPDGVRFVSYNTVSYPIIHPGWYITPTVGLHLSRYQTNWYTEYKKDWERQYPHSPFPFLSQAGTQRSVINRVLPIFSLDAGMTFERETTLFGKPMLQTLEPRLFYVYIPYVNQSDIPIYDTTLSQFGFGTAYEVNRYVGGWDRINAANQLTIGATSRWVDANDGQERLSLQFAQRLYFSDKRVFLNNESRHNYGRSDYLFAASSQITDTMSIDFGQQMTSKKLRLVARSFSLRWKPKRLASFALSYRYQRDPIIDPQTGTSIAYQLPGQNTWSVTAQWPFSSRFTGVARVDYSQREHRLTQSIVGLEYQGDCCWNARLVWQKYVIGKNQQNSVIFLQVQLQGLGAVGSSPANLLKRSINGYEPITPPPLQHSLFERYE